MARTAQPKEFSMTASGFLRRMKGLQSAHLVFRPKKAIFVQYYTVVLLLKMENFDQKPQAYKGILDLPDINVRHYNLILLERTGKMRLSTKARYGLRALCHVANRGYASAQLIADQQGIPSRYLEEIIGELRKAGFVVGKRGPRGGYRLAKPASEISLAEVLEVLTSHSASESEEVSDERQDEITRLVERSVDRRFQQAIASLDLEQLLGEARESYRRNAANYVI